MEGFGRKENSMNSCYEKGTGILLRNPHIASLKETDFRSF